MLKPRIIPCLLIKDGELIKTKNFKDPKYIGDPINAVKIFNEKNADELVFLDITASSSGKEPNYDLIKKIVRECRMPLCYGGAIKNIKQVTKIIEYGVEKIAISSASIDNPQLLSDIAIEIGSQSLVVVQDIKYLNDTEEYTIFSKNGTSNTNLTISERIKYLEELGVGEVIINSIDRDGMMIGYDLNLINKVMEKSRIPITFLGGAGSLDHLKEVVKEHKFIGLAAGSLFVYKGRFNAVLINYPSRSEKNKIYQ